MVPTASPHVLQPSEPLLTPEDGLLLGNGDLSVSVYRTADRIIWRFGKGDVWDRRIDRSEDPKPAHIDEVAHGISVEGWKCPPYGGPVEATRGTNNPQRMKEICQSVPPSYLRRPYPCPKPVGELALQLPADQPGLEITQRLIIEEARMEIHCRWRTGVALDIECFIPPTTNVLAVRWRVTGWTAETRTGNGTPPIWLSLYRWADPTAASFGARFYGEARHEAFRAMAGIGATPLSPPGIMMIGGTPTVWQSYSSDPTFPQGFDCVMTPFAPDMTVEPAHTENGGEARIHLIPRSDATHGTLVIAVTTASDDGGSVAAIQRIRGRIGGSIDAAVQDWETQTLAAGAEFWGRSAVRIADPLFENLWYETLHARRCTNRAGKYPPGLFLPSTVQDYSHWHGDYHTNYNLQEPFWGDYTANHTDLGDAYFDAMAPILQVGRKIAHDYYNARGAFVQLSAYPSVMTDDPLGCVPMGRMAYMTGWCSNQYWWRYLYTLDKGWLRAIGYPALKDCALFYTDFLKKGPDGLYHAFPSNQGEDGFTGDPKDYTDRGQIMAHMRYCLRSAIAASEALGVDAALRATWRDRLQHAAGDDGHPPEELTGREKECAELNPPEFGRGRPYRAQPENQVGKPWESPGGLQWYFGQVSWELIGKLRGGDFAADRDFPGFRAQVERWRHPNGLLWGMAVGNYGHDGAWTESLGVLAPLQEMMLQSWDGSLRVFPAWPRSIDARFDSFRAEGAFLVSAAWSKGAVTSLKIVSERGAPCRLQSPWTHGVRVVDSHGDEVPTTAEDGGLETFKTSPGGIYDLTAEE